MTKLVCEDNIGIRYLHIQTSKDKTRGKNKRKKHDKGVTGFINIEIFFSNINFDLKEKGTDKSP